MRTKKAKTKKWAGSSGRSGSRIKVPPPPTVEQLQAQITQIVELAETLMTRRPRPSFRLNALSMGFPALAKAHTDVRAARWSLEKLLHPNGMNVSDASKADEWFEATFADPAGTVPRWSRGGCFLMWLDYLPMLVRWSGILDHDLKVFAVDPDGGFIRQPDTVNHYRRDAEQIRAADSNGYIDLSYSQTFVLPKHMSVVDAVRGALEEIGPKLLLRPLSAHAKQSVSDTLATEPWIAEALKRGPEHKVDMPRHLSAIQQSLFG
jgi:hypothetical protein